MHDQWPILLNDYFSMGFQMITDITLSIISRNSTKMSPNFYSKDFPSNVDSKFDGLGD